MILCAILVVAAAGTGFGAGRVKNAAKLKAIHDEVTGLTGGLSADALALANRIKSHLGIAVTLK